MPRKKLKFIGIPVFLLLLVTGAFASLLDTPSPIFTQNHILGRNPARSALLREKNRFNVSYTLNTGLNYSDNFLRSDNTTTPLANEALDPNTNSYISGAIKIGGAYAGLIMNESRYDRRLREKYPPQPIGTDYSYLDSSKGFAIAAPLFNGHFYLGLELLQKDNLYTELTNGRQPSSLVSLQDLPYNTGTIGLLYEWNKILTLALTETVEQSRSVLYKKKTYVGPGPAYDEDEDTFTNYAPSCTGLGALLNIYRDIELGLGMEIYDSGQIYDYVVDNNHSRTIPFTKYIFAIEGRPESFFRWRCYDTYIREKDMRTNYYDWALFRQKVQLAPADNNDLLDDRPMVNIEDIGLDLEFIIANSISILLGTCRKSYIFPGNQPPYGYSTVIQDSRVYMGLSIGIFDEQKIVEPSSRPAGSVPVVHTTIAGPLGPEKPSTPVLVTKNAKTIPASVQQSPSVKEVTIFSAKQLKPGERLSVSIKEGPALLSGGELELYLKGENLSTIFLADDAGVWQAGLVIPPRTAPGHYKVKLVKKYQNGKEAADSYTITIVSGKKKK
jgi:hypothetical protein